MLSVGTVDRLRNVPSVSLIYPQQSVLSLSSSFSIVSRLGVKHIERWKYGKKKLLPVRRAEVSYEFVGIVYIARDLKCVGRGSSPDRRSIRFVVTGTRSPRSDEVSTIRGFLDDPRYVEVVGTKDEIIIAMRTTGVTLE